ncbi:lipopolysaccharide assembly protein LapA domain-containing protein [Desulfovibrio sp. OttesenSCG-928-M14]|nr:lipopolysaccharide assembly protein LapA domain-containing protein [Desulfovibrio sp. OttesenSCG-928-M14]
MRFVKVLLLLVLFIFGLLFFVQNSDALATNLRLQFDLYYGFKWEGQEIPFYFVVLAAFGLGMLFATLLLLIDRIRLGCSLMGRNRAVRSLEKEVERLRGELAKETRLLSAKSTEVKELPQPASA